MWSEGFNGRQGLTGAESYHRVGINVSAESFQGDSQWWRRAVADGRLSHIAIIFDRADSVDIAKFMNNLKTVGSMVSNPLKRLYITVVFQNFTLDDGQKLRDMCGSGLVHGITLAYQSNRERTVASLVALSEICAAHRPAVHLGLEQFPADELQWIMEHSSSVLNCIGLGIHTAPNLCLRQVDFAHSRLCNVCISIDTHSSEDSRFDYIRKLAENYNRPPAIVLAKALLQLGLVIMFSAECAQDFLQNWALSLAHPFTHRHIILAPQEPKTFIVSDPDIQYIVAASEVSESTGDNQKAAYEPPIARELSFPNTLGEM